jgi:Fe-S cluster assembly scaffold protein SufB
VYGLINVTMGEESRIRYRIGGGTGLMTRVRLTGLLSGTGSRIDGVIGVVSEDSSKGDIIFNTIHEARETTSIVIGRGVAADRGKLSLRGTARINNTARESRTRMEMHVTIVGELAKGRSVPNLEIYTGDVEEASHSASVTVIGGETLFYLRTRGLSQHDIAELIKHSLLESAGVVDVLERVKIG